MSTRREWLGGVLGAAASGFAAPTAFDPDYGSALAAAEAIRTRKVSSVELTQRALDRIARHNPKLNAMALVLRDEALARAREADQALARKQNWGALHGVPIHIKDSFWLKGTPATWGMKEAAAFKSDRNAVAVDRLLGGGAVILGKTNVPVRLSDWQSFNPVYGVTNNPWDAKRTPGGSTGGGAAALAAGLGYLTLGSDIGGSIRVPAHFCGIYGHKPTIELVSTEGEAPSFPTTLPGLPMDLAVDGPLARHAEDLLAALLLLGGPNGAEAKAWKWTMPAPRARRLAGFRVGCVPDDAFCRLSPDVAAVMDKALASIEKAGVRVQRGWPPGLDPAKQLDSYMFLLGALLTADLPVAALEQFGKGMPKSFLASASAPHKRWLAETQYRLATRAVWESYFREIDVFLAPVNFVAAFPHDHSDPMGSRVLSTPAGPRPYLDQIRWVSMATFAGLPATAAPAGRTAEGLPVGLQIIGPYLEDATTIEFAAQMAGVVGGFQPPPGYSG